MTISIRTEATRPTYKAYWAVLLGIIWAGFSSQAMAQKTGFDAKFKYKESITLESLRGKLIWGSVPEIEAQRKQRKRFRRKQTLRSLRFISRTRLCDRGNLLASRRFKNGLSFLCLSLIHISEPTRPY